MHTTKDCQDCLPPEASKRARAIAIEHMLAARARRVEVELEREQLEQRKRDRRDLFGRLLLGVAIVLVVWGCMHLLGDLFSYLTPPAP